MCERVNSNTKDPYAVAVTRDSTVVGHVPRKLSATCALFLRTQGTIVCTVTGTRHFSDDLPQEDWRRGISLVHLLCLLRERVPHSRTGPSCCRYLSRAIGTQIKPKRKLYTTKSV